MIKKTRYILIFIVAAVVLSPIIATFGYWEVECTSYQTKQIPVVYYRLYDPAGTDSYQEITETLSSAISLKFEAEVSGNKVSSSATVSTSASVGVRTVDKNTDPTINGIGKGDVISGAVISYTVKVVYIAGINTWGTYYTVKSVTLQNINWGVSYFDVGPAEFKTLFGKDAPSKIGSPSVRTDLLTVGKGISKILTNTLKIETEQSLSIGFEFPISGLTVKSKVTTTFKAGYEIKVKTFIKDTQASISQLIRYSGKCSGTTNVLADSMIPWFTYPRYTFPYPII